MVGPAIADRYGIRFALGCRHCQCFLASPWHFLQSALSLHPWGPSTDVWGPGESGKAISVFSYRKKAIILNNSGGNRNSQLEEYSHGFVLDEQWQDH